MLTKMLSIVLWCVLLACSHKGIAITSKSLPQPQISSGVVDSLRPLLRIPQKARYAAVDGLSNLYLISDKNRVEKYDSTGRLQGFYVNNRLGPATSIDLQNPLKIMLWYADQQQIVFLDRTLSEMGVINLQNSGFQQVSAAAASSDGNIWLYDAVDFRLYKLSPDGKRLFESQATNLFDLPPRQATQLMENNGSVWLAEHDHAVWEFDLFAQLKVGSKVPFALSHFCAWAGAKCYLSDERYLIEGPQPLSYTEERWPKNGKWLASRQYFICIGPDAVEIFHP
jgi:hypothetical protein